MLQILPMTESFSLEQGLSMLDDLHVRGPQREVVSPQVLTTEQLSWVAESHLPALTSLLPEFGSILPEQVPDVIIALARRCLDGLLSVGALPPPDMVDLDWALAELEQAPSSFRFDIAKAFSPFLAEAKRTGIPAAGVRIPAAVLSNSSEGAIVAFQRERTPKTTYRKIGIELFQSPNDKEASDVRSELQLRLGRENVSNKQVVDELVRVKALGTSASDQDGNWYSSIEQLVKRSRNLERAHSSLSKCFPKGIPVPFDTDAERIARARLKADSIPQQAIDTLLKRLKNLLKS